MYVCMYYVRTYVYVRIDKSVLIKAPSAATLSQMNHWPNDNQVINQIILQRLFFLKVILIYWVYADDEKPDQ